MPQRGRQAVVVGIHALPYAKNIGMTERASGGRAILGALSEAGLSPADVDGMFRFSWESTSEMEMARILGVPNLRAFGSVDYGGGAGCPTVAHAAMAIELGLADVVVAWRARNRGSGGRPWMSQIRATGQDQFEWPHGLLRPVESLALHTRHWFHTRGWSRETLGQVAITIREHASRNPAALMRSALTIDDYLAARMISDPLCLFDCCLETDGALAMVMVSADRARNLDLAVGPAYVHSYAMGSGPQLYAANFFYGPEVGTTPAAYVAQELWARSGLKPSDIQVVQWYDAFSPQIPISFEEYGFCGFGEAPAYLASPEVTPYNTSGGGLSEAYVHGFNHLLEGVRQVRGTSSSQVADVRHCLVTSGNVVPTGAIVFASEPW